MGTITNTQVSEIALVAISAITAWGAEVEITTDIPGPDTVYITAMYTGKDQKRAMHLIVDGKSDRLTVSGYKNLTQARGSNPLYKRTDMLIRSFFAMPTADIVVKFVEQVRELEYHAIPTA